MPITVTKENENENEYRVFSSEILLGKIEVYTSPFYAGNCYLRLSLAQYDPSLSTELFSVLKRLTGHPLQVMTESENAVLTDFLKAGGFELKRRCFESEVSAADFIGGAAPGGGLFEAAAGSAEYLSCCELLYDYHKATHRKINPLTSSLGEFQKMLPKTVVFDAVEGKILNFAFVEENEIAYLGSADIGSFRDFAFKLVGALFEKYETLVFESDDCDPLAMGLRSLFKNQDDSSFDTYVLL
ncbi:MAG: hypothetical protein ACI4IW_05610 [Oscillospiraceae bacterium]